MQIPGLALGIPIGRSGRTQESHFPSQLPGGSEGSGSPLPETQRRLSISHSAEMPQEKLTGESVRGYGQVWGPQNGGDGGGETSTRLRWWAHCSLHTAEPSESEMLFLLASVNLTSEKWLCCSLLHLS